MIDTTSDEGGGAHVSTTIRHIAIQVSSGVDSIKQVLQDIIVVKVSKDSKERYISSTNNQQKKVKNPFLSLVKRHK